MQRINRDFVCSPQSAQNSPLDPDQLARYALGDKYAEQTIMSLFQTQSRILMKRIREAKTETESRGTARTIKESAFGIGAYLVVEDAERTVQSLELSYSCDRLSTMYSLEKHVQEVNQFIDTRLDNIITATPA